MQLKAKNRSRKEELSEKKRQKLIEESFGKYSSVPASSEVFSKEKKTEIKRENRRTR